MPFAEGTRGRKPDPPKKRLPPVLQAVHPVAKATIKKAPPASTGRVERNPDAADRSRAARKSNVARGARPSGGMGAREVKDLSRLAKRSARMPVGEAVAAFQSHLADEGFDIAVDGVWGPRSQKAWAVYAGVVGKQQRYNFRSRVERALRDPSRVDPDEKLRLFGFQGATAIDNAHAQAQVWRRIQNQPRTPTVGEIPATVTRTRYDPNQFKEITETIPNPALRRMTRDEQLEIALEQSGIFDIAADRGAGRAQRILRWTGETFVVGQDLAKYLRGGEASASGIAADIALLPFLFAKGPVAGLKALERGAEFARLTPDEMVATLSKSEKRLWTLAQAARAAGRDLTPKQLEIAKLVEDPVARFKKGASHGYDETPIRDLTRDIRTRWQAVRGFKGGPIELSVLDPMMGPIRHVGELIATRGRNLVVRTEDGLEHTVPLGSIAHFGDPGSTPDEIAGIFPLREEALRARGAPMHAGERALEISRAIIDEGHPLPGRLQAPEELAAAVERVFQLAREGAANKDWYRRAAKATRILADHYGVEPKIVAQIIAITSQGVDTVTNIAFTKKALEQWQAGKPIWSGRFPTAQSEEIEKVFRGEPWEGRKRNSFYMNIIEEIDPDEYRRMVVQVGREAPVTVDMWVVRMFAPFLERDVPDQYYEAFERLIVRMADEYGWTPKELQAAAWVAAKTRGLLSDKIRRGAAKGSIARPSEESLDRFGRDAYEIGVARATGRADLDAGVAGDGRGRGNPDVRFAELDPADTESLARFVAAVRANPSPWSVSEPTLEQLLGARVFLSEDGGAGFSLSRTGELFAVFRNDPSLKGAGTEAALQAAARGSTWLNVYGIPALQRVYERAGFVEVARLRFNEEIVTEAFGPEVREVLRAQGDPDVVFMAFGAQPHPVRVFDDWDDAENYTRTLARPASPAGKFNLEGFEVEQLRSRAALAEDVLRETRKAESVLRGLDPPPNLIEADEERDASAWRDLFSRVDGLLRDIGRQPGLTSGALPFAGALDEAGERGLDIPYDARWLRAGDYTVQAPRARTSRLAPVPERAKVTRLGESIIDAASRGIDRQWVRDTAGIRVMTMTERAAKAGGRLQRKEMYRRQARVAGEIKQLLKVKEGSNEDIATFWYAQLPASHRNAEGLRLIQGQQKEELDYLLSGRALEDLDAREAVLRMRQGALRTDPDASPTDALRLINEIEEVRRLRTDIPLKVQDVSASIARLDEVIAVAPQASDRLLEALRKLTDDRERFLLDGDRLAQERAIERKGIVARWLGLEPDGTEIYMGHRLPRSDQGTPMQTSRGGTGRVSSPQGMSRNRLLLAATGRLVPSTRVAVSDWQQAAVFDEAIESRDALWRMGEPFKGNYRKGYLLVNPDGRVVPAYWRSEELQQFAETADDITEVRALAEDVISGWASRNSQEDWQRMLDEAVENGTDLSRLRMVPERLVSRYYAQFRSTTRPGPGGQAWDSLVDFAAASIIFARVGYIPKNIVQNVIMALPHQGGFFPVNAVRAGQALADPELRYLLRAEVGQTVNSALAREASTTVTGKALGALADFVSKFADEPARVSAFLHEAAAEGVISRVNPLLTERDRENLIRLLTDPDQRERLNDISWRSIEAMADFGRLTPDQSRWARRLLIIPGWLVAGSRYPFHFAATHPIRAALLAYIAMGEPGAPDELRFNEPVTHYMSGRRWLRGFDTPWGRLRTSSLNPVSTPWEIALALGASAKGIEPFDYETDVAFDYANPILAAAVAFLEGEGPPGMAVLKRLVPNYSFIEGMLDPRAHKNYPEDATRWGRLKREIGILPIEVIDDPPKKSRRRSGSINVRGGKQPPGSILGGGSRSGGGSILRP